MAPRPSSTSHFRTAPTLSQARP